VIEITHMPLPAHALRAGQDSLKTVSNERHLTLEAGRLLRTYLPAHCSEVTQMCKMTLPAHALQALHVRFMLVTRKEHFTLETETFFRPYLP
jgi:hypothetical protein